METNSYAPSADDGEAKRTPSAWTISINLHPRLARAKPAPKRALGVVTFNEHKWVILRERQSLTDRDRNLRRPDTDFMGGTMSAEHQSAEGSAEPGLYAAERYGHFTYAIPVDTRGRSTLVLHFAEFYSGPAASGAGGAGSRLFRVLCNRDTLLDDFDIFKEAGSSHALTKTFFHFKPTAQGKLNLTFEPIVNDATVSCIEVLDESL